MTVSHIPAPVLSGRLDPEDGPLAKRVFQSIMPHSSRAIMGFACEAGVRRNKGRLGAKLAPDAIRNALAGLAIPAGFQPISDLGTVTVDGDALAGGQTLLAHHLTTALLQYRRIVVLGGGHETAFGSWQGLKATYPDQSIGIINLDAHLDLRNMGELGGSSGTPFNQIRHADPDGFDYLCIGVARESNTQALFERAKDWGVKTVSDTDLAHNADAANSQIEAICKRSDIIYLTIDIDVMPHYQAPGVSAPAARGVAFTTVEGIIQQVRMACQTYAATLPLADIVEVSPPHDRDGMTAKTAAILALSLLKE